MASVYDVANYVLCKEKGTPEYSDISNLKLQKLVYYIQGYSLALLDKPMFDEEIRNWMHGPVVEELYQFYKYCGSNPIVTSYSGDIYLNNVNSIFTLEEQELMDDVYNEFSQYSAWALRNMTHDEDPWKNTDQNDLIDRDILSDYFKRRVEQSV